MKRIAPVTVAILALVFSSLACSAFKKEMSLTNLRMATDQDGKNVTTTFSPTDVFYALADLQNAPKGTVVKAKWSVVKVPGLETEPEFPEQTIDITEDVDAKTVYFKLANGFDWPAGSYRVEIYLNDTLAQSMEFKVE